MGCACSEDRAGPSLPLGKPSVKASVEGSLPKAEPEPETPKHKRAAPTVDIDVGLRSGDKVRRLLEPVSREYRILTSEEVSDSTHLVLAEHIRTKQRCRIKVVDKGPPSGKKSPAHLRLLAEADILRQLDHPHILKVLDVMESKDSCYLVSEGFDGKTLQKQIEESGPLEETQAAEVMRQVFSAVHYCHKNEILLRNLGPDKIVFDSTTEEGGVDAKIFDFDDACVLAKRKSITCYSEYIAPETYTESYSDKADVWSCGILAYFLLYGKSPYGDFPQKKVRQGKIKTLPTKTDRVSTNAVQFLTRLLSKNANTRPSAGLCLTTPWLHFSTQDKPQRTKNVRTSLLQLQSSQAESKVRLAIKLFLIYRVVPRADILALKHSFQALDINGDGQISKEELLAGLQKVMPNDRAAEEVDRIFTVADSNKNGFIDYSEFLVSAFRNEKLLSRKNLLTAFNSFDKDDSGKISLDELKEVLVIQHQESEKVWKMMMAGLDASGDGEIDYQEFRTLMLQTSDDECPV